MNLNFHSKTSYKTGISAYTTRIRAVLVARIDRAQGPLNSEEEERLMKRAALLVLLLLFVLSGLPAFADLNGANVTVNYLYPEINDIYQVLGTGTVTPSGFTVNSFGQHDFTTFPSDLMLTNVAGEDINFTGADFNGYGLVVNSGGTAITGVTIGFNNISGFDLTRVTFDATDVWVNLQGLTTTPGEDLDLDLQFSGVPEPGSIALLGSGLIAAFGVVRRKLR
jgi:PEP-CTERM motif